jgi:Mor family transcriptional regulator
MNEIVQDLDFNINDISSEHMQMVADRCGVSDAVSLMLHVPGLELYIPLAGKKSLNINYIKLNFNGHNTSSIAVKLGIDNKTVKKLARRFSAQTIEPIYKNKSMLIVAKMCGETTAIHLMQEFPLHTFYVPKNGFEGSIRKYIERNFDGKNHPELALKCNVTERHVRQVVADMYNSKAQLSLNLFQ